MLNKTRPSRSQACRRCETRAPGCMRGFGPGSIPVCRLSGAAELGMDSVYARLCLQQWTAAWPLGCMAPGLHGPGLCRTTSGIALQGKWSLCHSTAEHTTVWGGGALKEEFSPWFLRLCRPRATFRGRRGGTVHTGKQRSVTGVCLVTALRQTQAPPFEALEQPETEE